MLDDLKLAVLDANLELRRSGLVKLTWGNVSGIDRARGVFAIKPSGVPYDQLRVEHMVLCDLEGRVVDGKLNPSSDTPTHAALYRGFPAIGGITHTHSEHATMFAQACRDIPCLGTTHADHFCGPVPLTRALTPREVKTDYEGSTGTVIVECFRTRDPVAIPGVLVAHHGPFTWGRTPDESVRNSIALETIAAMALGSLTLSRTLKAIPAHILKKHYTRKHGPKATYGQKS